MKLKHVDALSVIRMFCQGSRRSFVSAPLCLALYHQETFTRNAHPSSEPIAEIAPTQPQPRAPLHTQTGSCSYTADFFSFFLKSHFLVWSLEKQSTRIHSELSL
jgi:hypothetical protein